MNDTNNVFENSVTDTQEKTIIEYVNPLNPNEVLKVKDLSNNKVNNLNENDVTKDIETNEEVAIKPPKKRKNKLVTIIVALIALAIILTSILLIPKIFNNEDKKPVDTPPQVQEQAKIQISDIIANATNNTYYKLLNTTYVVNINNINDTIVFDLSSIDQTNPITKQIVFTLSDRNLKLQLNTAEDNSYNLFALYAVLDGIGQYYGHEIDEVGNYLYSVQNNYNFNTNGITTTELTTDVLDSTTGIITPVPNGQVEISINIDTNISTTGLETMYLTLEELNIYKDAIVNSTIDLKKGDLILYTNNSDIYTILIGQRKELSNNTYNTISSVIELLYPEEINDFKSKFTSLSTISFDKYKITVDPVLDANTYSQYQSNYKFILIEITKQAL